MRDLLNVLCSASGVAILGIFQGFTNFMPRFAVRSFCGLLDSEIVEIKNEEELRTVYGEFSTTSKLNEITT